jgi:DNA-binding NtrC family response regulator
MAFVAIVDDQRLMRESMAETLSSKGCRTEVFTSGADALAAISADDYDVLITDLKMPQMSGLELLAKAAEVAPGLPVVVITAHGTVESAVDAMKRGAFDYIVKPFESDELEMVVDRAVSHRHLVRENELLKRRVSEEDSAPIMVGADSGLQAVSALIERVAPTDATVLVSGQSGTGKEVIARRIHHMSRRREKPFVCVNCAALNAGLLESELFGHEKGAFTGADRMRRGRFELAEGGTTLLDEVSEIDPHLQAKLLRVLQEREYERVGSSVVRRMDVRVIVTTNRDLAKEVASGRFREDLYYRLNVFPIHVPALSERQEDVAGLARHFLRQLARQSGREAPEVTQEAMSLLTKYAWPGNVRELKNVMERAFIMGLGDRIESGHIEAWLCGDERRESGPTLRPGMTIKDAEETLIRMTLEKYSGHREKTAQALGISVRTLINRLREWKMETSEANVA